MHMRTLQVRPMQVPIFKIHLIDEDCLENMLLNKFSI